MRTGPLASLLVFLGCVPTETAEPTPEPTPEACADEPAPKSDPCLPDCGNELFIGMPSSEGGGECSDHVWPEARLCTADFDDGNLDFCTRPCVAHEDCGLDAICVGDTENPQAGNGCFPLSCWEGEFPPDPAGDDDDSAH